MPHSQLQGLTSQFTQTTQNPSTVMKKTLGICQSGTFHLLRSQAITCIRKINQESECISFLTKSLFITRFLYQFGKTKNSIHIQFFSSAFLLEPPTYSTSTMNWRFILLNLKQKKEALKTEMFPYRERKPRPYPWEETIHLSCTFTVLPSASHLGICQ